MKDYIVITRKQACRRAGYQGNKSCNMATRPARERKYPIHKTSQVTPAQPSRRPEAGGPVYEGLSSK